MQSDTVDRKIKIIFDHYNNSSYAKHAQEDIEQIRNRATNWGLGITTGAFIANEFVRMTMRSRKFATYPFTFYLYEYSTLQGCTTQCSFMAHCSNLHCQINS